MSTSELSPTGRKRRRISVAAFWEPLGRRATSDPQSGHTARSPSLAAAGMAYANIYRKYYGTKMMLILLATFYASMVAAGYIVELLFGTVQRPDGAAGAGP